MTFKKLVSCRAVCAVLQGMLLLVPLCSGQIDSLIAFRRPSYLQHIVKICAIVQEVCQDIRPLPAGVILKHFQWPLVMLSAFYFAC